MHSPPEPAMTLIVKVKRKRLTQRPKGMAALSENNPLQLSPDSFYIGTSQVFGRPGKFHWSIYSTDENCNILRVHWAVTPGTDFAEGVVYEDIASLRTYSETNVLTFVCANISGVRMPPLDVFRTLAGTVFANTPHGYSSVKENRDRNITCRTWLLRLLKAMMDKGYVSRPPDTLQTVKEIEKCIIEISIEVEDKLLDDTFSEAHVIDI
ncbi:hypothetical protein BDZ89DRAFT_1114053 [Hymenopellis radicata]|nr:hypothetical protein BDZ89DRAFT_1114053 [Hymenopellis radicata]